MRKALIFLAAFLTLSSIDALAQVSIGVGSGSRVYSLKQADIVSASAVHLSLEAEASFRLGKRFGVSAGASLAGSAGYHFGGDETKNLGEIYLEIPVRGKVFIPLGATVDLYLFAGPSLSVDLYSIDAHTKSSVSNFETYPTMTRLDVMLGGGIGLEIIRHIRVSLSYDQGLMDRDTAPSVTAHTGVAKATVAYMF